MQPWKDITTDFIMGLPEVQGYDALFVTCCRHTKQAHIIPTSTTTSARGLATLFRDHVWKPHSLSETALFDRGPQFVAEFMKELNKILGIKTKLSMAYHLQTDGQTEQVNQEIEQYSSVIDRTTGQNRSHVPNSHTTTKSTWQCTSRLFMLIME